MTGSNRPVWCRALVVALSASLLALSGAAHATSSYLVMAEDASPQTIARHEQLSQQVLNGLAGEMAKAGLNVYDETAISYENYIQGRSRRPNDELIDIAASIRSPIINVVIFVVVERDARPGKYFDRVGLKLSALMLNVQSGKVLGAVEHAPKPWSLPTGCAVDVACVTEALARNPQAVGSELAHKVMSALEVRQIQASHHP